MPIKRLSQTSLASFQKHSNLLAGNPAFNPNSFDLLETTLISTNTASVTFSNLNNYSDYKHLQVRVTGRVSTTQFDTQIRVRLNADSGSNYAFHTLFGSGSSVSSSASTSQTSGRLGFFPDANQTANIFGALVFDLLDFASANKTTTIRSFSGQAGTNNSVNLNSTLWNNTAAVTSLTVLPLTGNFVSGSRLSLYGIK